MTLVQNLSLALTCSFFSEWLNFIKAIIYIKRNQGDLKGFLENEFLNKTTKIKTKINLETKLILVKVFSDLMPTDNKWDLLSCRSMEVSIPAVTIPNK